MGFLVSSRNSGKDKLFQFTQGIDLDQRLANEEVKVQCAWARALAAKGLLTEQELKSVLEGLAEALKLMTAGEFEWKVENEDIHMNLECFLVERYGELGKKIHRGRSRNDLIATTLKLFVKSSLEEVISAVTELGSSLIERAEADIHSIVPGMTHLQGGQPVRLGHMIAAHGWSLARDLNRLKWTAEQTLDSMPLGAAALNGTHLDLDLTQVAQELGFKAPSFNSYDSVGDRDFIIEALNGFAMIAVHLSRISEDFIIWSSNGFGLYELPKDWSTGSSIMPNKRNPDVAELIRAKSSHIMSAAWNGQSLLKGMPSGYGSDLHELKRVYLRSLDQLQECLDIFPHFIRGLKPSKTACERLLNQGHILATEVANAGEGPFRAAYQATATLVELAETKGVQIHELSPQDMAAVLGDQPLPKAGLDFQSAVESRNNSGGTSLQTAQAGLAQLKIHFTK